MPTAPTSTFKFYQPSPRERILAACLAATVHNEVHWTHKYRYRKGWCRAGYIPNGDLVILHMRQGKALKVVDYTAELFVSCDDVWDDRRDSLECAYGSMLDEFKAIRRIQSLLHSTQYKNMRRGVHRAFIEEIPSRKRREAIADRLLIRAAKRNLTGNELCIFVMTHLEVAADRVPSKKAVT